MSVTTAPPKAPDNTWEKYTLESHKYSMPRLTAVHNIVQGRTTKFKMQNYCPQSIGFWLAFETFLNSAKCPVTHIDASNSPFTESACYSLSDVLENSKTLVHLNMSNCRIGPRGIEALQEGLNYMHCITYLNLSGCNLRDNGGIIVADAFRNNDTCTVLNLSHNLLGSGTGRALGDMLTRNEGLVELELGWNSLYSELDCTVPLLQGIAKNESLQTLGLSWNGIMTEPEIADSLRKMCLVNKRLVNLNLEYNRFTGLMKDVAEGLRRSKSLRVVKLGGNPLSVADIDGMLVEFKAKIAGIRELSFGKYKYLTKEHAALLQKVKAQNPKVHIEFAGIIRSAPAKEADFKPILMARVRALAMKPKKPKLRRDMALFFLQLRESAVVTMNMDDWLEACKAFGAKIDEPLCRQIGQEWQDPKTEKISVQPIVDYYLSLYPSADEAKSTLRRSTKLRDSLRKSMAAVPGPATDVKVVATEPPVAADIPEPEMASSEPAAVTDETAQAAEAAKPK